MSRTSSVRPGWNCNTAFGPWRTRRHPRRGKFVPSWTLSSGHSVLGCQSSCMARAIPGAHASRRTAGWRTRQVQRPHYMTSPIEKPSSKTCKATEATYRRTAAGAARKAIQEWLRRVDRRSMHSFDVNGVKCALEFFTGHWGGVEPYGMVEGGRWRWKRLDAGDPDEDESGEDVLLEVALGRPLSPEPPEGLRKRRPFPAFSEGELTTAEIRTLSLARAKENLAKLVLRRLPRA